MIARGAPLAAVAVALFFAACEKPAPPDLLHLPDGGLSAWASPKDAGPPWVRSYCAPLPEPTGTASFSDLTMTGECTMHTSLPVQCLALADDFYFTMVRPLEGGRSIELFVNVESYSGPGEYEHKAEVRILLKDKATLYQWVHYQTSVTLGSAELAGATGTFKSSAPPPVNFVVLKPTQLYAAPGTPASGFIDLSGTAVCAPPGMLPAMATPAP